MECSNLAFAATQILATQLLVRLVRALAGRVGSLVVITTTIQTLPLRPTQRLKTHLRVQVGGQASGQVLL
jgi:uncharacterized membrane protein YkgB